MSGKNLLEQKQLAIRWEVSPDTVLRIRKFSPGIRPVRWRGLVPQFTEEQAERLFARYQRHLAQVARRACR